MTAAPTAIALAWHDVVCPEGSACRSRDLHAASEPVVTSGLAYRFVTRLAELREAEREAPRPDPVVSDVCPHPIRVDGTGHSWRFDGDDPYIVCHGCGEVRDALTGRVVTAGRAEVTG